MKNLFQIILALALAVLYVLHFTSSDNASSSEKKDAIETSSSANIPKSDSKIAYVNTDTLWQNYDFYQEMKEDLLKEKQILEKQYENRVRKLEEKVLRFREKAPYLSQREGERQQTAIMEEEQQIVQLQEELSLQLAESESDKNKAIRGKILSELESFNKELGYDFILGYSLSSDVIYAEKSLDVTETVLNRLNAKYREEKQIK